MVSGGDGALSVSSVCARRRVRPRRTGGHFGVPLRRAVRRRSREQPPRPRSRRRPRITGDYDDDYGDGPLSDADDDNGKPTDTDGDSDNSRGSYSTIATTTKCGASATRHNAIALSCALAPQSARISAAGATPSPRASLTIVFRLGSRTPCS